MDRRGRGSRRRGIAEHARRVRLPQQPPCMARTAAGRLRRSVHGVRASAGARNASAVILGTSTSGLLHTELAYRRRASDGSLPADFRYAQTQNSYSLAAFVAQALGVRGPSCGRLDRMLVEREGVRQRGAADRRRTDRRGRGRRRRQLVLDDAVRLQLARAARQRHLPPVGRRSDTACRSAKRPRSRCSSASLATHRKAVCSASAKATTAIT